MQLISLIYNCCIASDRLYAYNQAFHSFIISFTTVMPPNLNMLNYSTCDPITHSIIIDHFTILLQIFSFIFQLEHNIGF